MTLAAICNAQSANGRLPAPVKPSSQPGIAQLMSLAAQQLAPFPGAPQRISAGSGTPPVAHFFNDERRTPPPQPPRHAGSHQCAGPLTSPPETPSHSAPVNSSMPLSQLMKQACQAVPSPSTGAHPFLTKGQLKRIKAKGGKAGVGAAPPRGAVTPPPLNSRAPQHVSKVAPAPLRVPEYLRQAYLPDPSPPSPSVTSRSADSFSEDDSLGYDSESWVSQDSSPLLKGFGSSLLPTDQLEGHTVFQALAFDLLESAATDLVLPLSVIQELQIAAL